MDWQTAREVLMLGDLIIAAILFGAFYRAAGEYNKNGFAWGFIGLAAFFVPNYVFTLVIVILMATVGARNTSIGGWLPLSALLGFVASVTIVVWTYNKLMDRAINEQAARDAQASALAGLQRLSSGH
jgi:hypothetical protein